MLLVLGIGGQRAGAGGLAGEIGMRLEQRALARVAGRAHHLAHRFMQRGERRERTLGATASATQGECS